jgi:hypothetical protein
MEEEKNKGEIFNRLGVWNERFNEKLEQEKLQRSKDISVLREEMQQTIQGVNGKLNNLSSSMYASLELQKSETKQIQFRNVSVVCRNYYQLSVDK